MEQIIYFFFFQIGLKHMKIQQNGSQVCHFIVTHLS